MSRHPFRSKQRSSRTMRRLSRGLLLFFACALPSAGFAFDEAAIPPPLREWIPWVLDGQEAARCPVVTSNERACAWPSRLVLELEGNGARFSMDWRVFAETTAPLPGDERTWPREVRVDGETGVVSTREGRPALRLAPGTHRVTGTLVWRKRPALLAVPPEIGLLTLTRDGERVALPERESDGRVWLGVREKSTAETERVALDVRRLIRDDVPMGIETSIDLDVAGANRELRIADGVLEGFEPVVLESELPVRIVEDGRLLVQVRPGHFTVRLLTRSRETQTRIALPADAGDGMARDSEEVWAFAARPALRVVDLQGGVPVDPEQTTLPAAWRGYPAFAVGPGQSLQWIERRRGDAEPAPDALSLTRTLWLDFDGSGFTAQDHWTGEMHRSWRLDAAPGLELGRVSIDGRDQPITTLAGSDLPGVEVRSGAVSLTADARIPGRRSAIPAIGWRHDAVSLGGELRLPPGWQLLHASGVDAAAPSWLTSWTLLDLFLVLVIALAAAKLFGAACGALALAALVLSWMEPAAPRWVWALALASEALVRGVTSARWSPLARSFRLAALLWLCVAGVSFSVSQLRFAFHPALERGAAALVDPTPREAAAESEPSADSAAPLRSESEIEARSSNERVTAKSAPRALRRGVGAASKPAAAPAPAAEPYYGSGGSVDPERFDPSISIATGPGLPSWRWQRIQLEWHGPVAEGESLRFWLLSPRERFLLAFACVALVGGFILVLLRGARDDRRNRRGPSGGATQTGVASSESSGERTAQAAPADSHSVARAVCAIGFAAVTLLAIPAPSVADWPSEELLGRLRERVLREPACRPECTTIGWMRIEAAGDAIRLRLEADAAEESTVPLPGATHELVLDAVLLDGVAASALRRAADGTLWMVVPRGRHQIVLDARAPGAREISLSLPLRPHFVEASLAGWSLDGAGEDGRIESTLRLVREPTAPGAPAANAGSPSAAVDRTLLPPFFEVARTIAPGLRWMVTTSVERVTPPGVASTIRVPLLSGESSTSDRVRVENGIAVVSLGPQETRVEWSSVLEPAGRLVLRAPRDVPFVERWRLDASALWHVEPVGIAPIHDDAPGRVRRIREWRPWPGEEVTLEITRPRGVPGATLTIDRATLSVAPGLRASDFTLTFDVRSSRGGRHEITLPADAELTQVQIEREAQPLRLDAGRLALPISPGSRSVVVGWREARGITNHWNTSIVDLGATAVDVGIEVEMPLDRWTLWLRGPGVGPAVLFWSTLAVLIALAIGLGRTKLAPLGVPSWLLLGIGLAQVSIEAAAVVVVTLLALGWRSRVGARLPDGPFRLLQLALFALAMTSLVILFAAIRQGLLGMPEMQIAGNASNARQLRWYVDRTDGVLPAATLVSAPLFVYRMAMLAWALWLASALLRWIRFAAAALAAGGGWRAIPWRPKRAAREMRPAGGVADRRAPTGPGGS